MNNEFLDRDDDPFYPFASAKAQELFFARHGESGGWTDAQRVAYAVKEAMKSEIDKKLVIDETDKVKRLAAELTRDAIRDAQCEVKALEQVRDGHAERIRALTMEKQEMRIALNALRTERDPGLLERERAVGRDEGRAEAQADNRRLRSENADLKSQLAELQASKKKLREACERLKEGRR